MDKKFTVKVYLWGIHIGNLSWDSDMMCSVFAFSDEYLDSKYDISPNRYPKAKIQRRAFYGSKAFEGLPEFLADSLPDDWGNTLFDKWTSDNHIPLNDMRSLMKLSFIGKRGMGALEYVPSIDAGDYDPKIDVDALYKEAMNVLYNRESVLLDQGQDAVTLKKLILLGTSVGGKHAKGLIAMNPFGIIRSGQIELPKDYKYYILKFKEDKDVPTSEIEFIYHEMATDADIPMMKSTLYNVADNNHFLTERFDRLPGGEKRFTQTLRAMSPTAADYMNIFWLCDTLGVPSNNKEKVFRQMVFNFMAGVTDDHSRNFSFVMDRDGQWSVSPAYDLMFTQNVWENPAAAQHCLAMWQKRAYATLEDFIDFGEDIDIPNVKKIIQEVADSVMSFPERCTKMGIDTVWSKKLFDVIEKLVPKELIRKTANPQKSLMELAMERIREKFPDASFSGTQGLFFMQKKTGELLHFETQTGTHSCVIDYESKEISICRGKAIPGLFAQNKWVTIDGKQAIAVLNRVYSLEFKKSKGRGW